MLMLEMLCVSLVVGVFKLRPLHRVISVIISAAKPVTAAAAACRSYSLCASVFLCHCEKDVGIHMRSWRCH